VDPSLILDRYFIIILIQLIKVIAGGSNTHIIMQTVVRMGDISNYVSK